MIGPNAGYAWARFTITDVALAINWDGSGSFEDGESEDYLIAINTETIDAEYGDALEGSNGYPSTGVMGIFPTCIFSGPPNHFVSHMMGEGIFFGPLKDHHVFLGCAEAESHLEYLADQGRVTHDNHVYRLA